MCVCTPVSVNWQVFKSVITFLLKQDYAKVIDSVVHACNSHLVSVLINHDAIQEFVFFIYKFTIDVRSSLIEMV